MLAVPTQKMYVQLFFFFFGSFTVLYLHYIFETKRKKYCQLLLVRSKCTTDQKH